LGSAETADPDRSWEYQVHERLIRVSTNKRDSHDLMRFSTIICTRNRSHAITRCLDSIDAAARKATLTDAEIIVVDNASDDDTSSVVNAWATRSSIPVRLESEPRPGLTFARNRGLRVARGDILTMTDDDCCVRDDYFAELLRLYADNREPVLRGGRVELGSPDDLPLTIKTDAAARRWHLSMASARSENLGDCLLGCNFSMSRQVYERLGPFDDNLGAGCPIPAGEDIEYAYRAYVANIAIEYTPSVVVFHYHGRRTSAEARRLLRNYMLGSGALYAKYLFKCPSLCVQVKWDLKNAIREIVGRKNLFLPEYEFSHLDKIAYYVSGAMSYVRNTLRITAVHSARNNH
jgi:glycosyltransferase involved in cell wall biosynthesis